MDSQPALLQQVLPVRLYDPSVSLRRSGPLFSRVTPAGRQQRTESAQDRAFPAMRALLPQALAQETVDDHVVDFLGTVSKSIQPSIQSGDQPKLVPDARGFVTLLLYDCDISRDERVQRT